MKYLLREPLVHFLLLSGLLFGFSQLSNYGGALENDEIVISQGQLDVLVGGFEKLKQRAPTPKELDHMIGSYVRDEVLYREALAMGLDKNDAVVRRRLAQKMMFLSENLSAANEPDDAELQRFLEQHVERFQRPARYSFMQVYLNVSERQTTLDADIASLREGLNSQRLQADSAGDSLMIASSFTQATTQQISRLLGERFTAGLAGLSVGSWQGPIESGFGVHLVLISEYTPPELPALAEVRDDVLRDWQARQRDIDNDEFYKVLQARYTITLPEGVAFEDESS